MDFSKVAFCLLLSQCASFSPPAGLHLKSFLPQSSLRVSYLKSFKLVESAELGSREMVDPALSKSWQWRRRNALGAPQQSFVAPIFMGGDDVLVCTIGGGVSLVDIKSGTAKWKLEVPIGVASKPFVSGSFIYVAGLDGWVRKLRADSGKLEWSSRLSSESSGGVVVNGSKVFVTSTDDSLWALDEKTGKSLWSYRRPSPQGNVYWSLRGASVPLVSPDGERVYGGFSDGYFVALETSSGATLWERNFERAGRFKDADQPFDLSHDGSQIFLPLVDGDLVVLKSSDGSSQWSISGAGGSSPLLDEAEGALYTSGIEGSLMKISTKDSKIVWSNRLSKTYYAQPVEISETLLAYMNAENGLLIVDRRTGDVVDKLYLGRAHLASPAFDGSRLLILTSRNQLIVYKIIERGAAAPQSAETHVSRGLVISAH